MVQESPEIENDKISKPGGAKTRRCRARGCISHPFHSLYPSTVLLSYRLFSITFHTDQTLDKSLRSSTVYSVYSLRFLILQVFFQFKCSLTVFSGSQFKIILFTVYYKFKFSHNLCAVKVLNTPRAGLKHFSFTGAR